MPSNNKKKNRVDDDDDLKQEANQKLQAVLLADAVFGSKVTGGDDEYQSFGLRPWSSDESTSSQILCPINNVPIVDYILDFLSSNGVEQVIIVIGTCAGSDDALEDYLMDTKRKQRYNFELLFLKDTSLTNAGDALRELSKRNWIRPSKQALPFLLVSGDVIADIDLREAMKAHKQRHSHDSAALMTIILKPVSTTVNKSSSSLSCLSNDSSPSIVPRASDLVVGLVKATAKTAATVDAQAGSNSSGNREEDSTSNNIDEDNDYRVMMYDNRSSNKSGVTLPCTFLTQSQSTPGGANFGGLSIRTDLMDTGISICSPDVLGRLEDEFDYLDLAHDFVTNSVAEEEDGLQTRIYAHVLESNNNTNSNNGNNRNYAARAVDFHTYHAISRDLLKRWAYPTVADRMATTTTNDGNDEDRLYKLVRVADHHRNSSTRSNSTCAAKAVADRARRYSNSGSRPRPLQSLENNPISPKNKDCGNQPICYSNNSQYQYKEMLYPTKFGRTSIIHGPGMMGSNGNIDEDCVIIRCVLGDYIQIDNNTTIEDCHLMDGVVVEANVTMDSCLIARNAIIRRGANLGKGCVIGEGCVIGKGVKLPPLTRITLAKDDDDDGLWGDDEDDGYSDSSEDSSGDNDSTDVEKSEKKKNAGADDNDHDVVGTDGIGRVWRLTLDYGDDDEYVCDDVDYYQDPFDTLINLQSVGSDPSSYFLKRERRLLAEEEEEFESDQFSDHENDKDDDGMMMAETQAFSKFTEGTVTFGDDDNDNNFGSTAIAAPDVIGRQKGIDVIKEMIEICMEFDDECHPIENLAIELNSYKFSQNATYGDCATATIMSLLCKMELSTDMSDGRLVSLLKTKLDKFWTGMLQKLCFGIPEELSILYALENAATIDQTSKVSSGDNEEAAEQKSVTTNIAQKLRSGMAFRFVLQTLHNEEVLSEEAILLWAQERREDNDDDFRSKLFAKKSVQDFLEWLEQESEDEDDSDDSDDED